MKDIQISSLDWGGQSVLFCTIIKFWQDLQHHLLRQQKPVSTMLQDLHKVWRTIAQEDLKKKLQESLAHRKQKFLKMT